MSHIEWTDKTWNPVTGCHKVSEGCRHCYAERISLDRNWSTHPWKQQYAAINVVTHEKRLQEPTKWKQGAVVFVNSMSDLFHELVPSSFLDQVFDVMAQTPRHFYLILTKRPQRMWAYVSTQRRVLPNVGLGVSVEDMRAVEKRIPLLVQTPAAMRFLSCEPLLGPLSFRKTWAPGIEGLSHIHWLIVGGESGPGARDMKEVWLRSIKEQALEYQTPFFFKQWGGYPDKRGGEKAILDGQIWHQVPAQLGKYIQQPAPIQQRLF